MPRWSLSDLNSFEARQSQREVLPPSRDNQRESILHDEIMQECRRLGWMVNHSRMDRPSTCGVGMPDFIILKPNGKLLLVEAKSSAGKLSAEQIGCQAMARRLGHTIHVVRSMSDFHAIK